VQSRKACQICGGYDHVKKITLYIEKERQTFFACAKCTSQISVPLQLKLTSAFCTTEKPIEHKCPTCGWTLGNFIASGTFGCPDCYREFECEAADAMTQIHGTQPREFVYEGADIESRITMLRERIKSAVEMEHFEEAAKLRDEITRLENNTVVAQ